MEIKTLIATLLIFANGCIFFWDIVAVAPLTCQLTFAGLVAIASLKIANYLAKEDRYRR